MLDLNSGNLSKEWTVDKMKLRHLNLMYGQAREKCITTVCSIMLKMVVGENKKLTIQSGFFKIVTLPRQSPSTFFPV